MITVTKKEMLTDFKDFFKDELQELKKDRIAKNELWWNFVDGLCKESVITESQYNLWSNPF